MRNDPQNPTGQKQRGQGSHQDKERSHTQQAGQQPGQKTGQKTGMEQPRTGKTGQTAHGGQPGSEQLDRDDEELGNKH